MSNHFDDATQEANRRLTTPQLLRHAAVRYAAARSSALEEWHFPCCPEPEAYPQCRGCPHFAEFKQLIRERILSR